MTALPECDVELERRGDVGRKPFYVFKIQGKTEVDEDSCHHFPSSVLTKMYFL